MCGWQENEECKHEIHIKMAQKTNMLMQGVKFIFRTFIFITLFFLGLGNSWFFFFMMEKHNFLSMMHHWWTAFRHKFYVLVYSSSYITQYIISLLQTNFFFSLSPISLILFYSPLCLSTCTLSPTSLSIIAFLLILVQNLDIFILIVINRTVGSPHTCCQPKRAWFLD